MLKYRLIYSLLFLSALAFSMLYRSQFASVLLVLVLAIPAVSFVLGLITSFFVKIKLLPQTQSVDKKQDFTVVVSLTNRSIFPAVPVRIIGKLPNIKNNSVECQQIFASVAPMSTVNIKLKGNMPYRGRYPMAIDKIYIYDLLKIFSFRKKLSVAAEAVVLPRIFPIQSIPSQSVSEDENLTRQQYGFNKTSFASIREYRRGDPLQTVHWKLSAKQDDMIVKEFEETLNSDSIIICDFGMPQSDKLFALTDGIVESALAVTRSLVEDLNSVTVLWEDFSAKDISGRIVENLTDFSVLFNDFAVLEAGARTMDSAAIVKKSQKDILAAKKVYIIAAHFSERIIMSFAKSFSNSNIPVQYLYVTSGEVDRGLIDGISASSGIVVSVVNPDEIKLSLDRIV